MHQIFSYMSADINSSKLSMMLTVLSFYSQDGVNHFFLRNNKALNSSDDWQLLVSCHLCSWNDWHPHLRGEMRWTAVTCALAAFIQSGRAWATPLVQRGSLQCSPASLAPSVHCKALHRTRGWHSYAALWTQKVEYAAHDLVLLSDWPIWLLLGNV